MDREPDTKLLLLALQHFSDALCTFVRASRTEFNIEATISPQHLELKKAARYCSVGKTKFLEYRDRGWITSEVVGGRPKYFIQDLDRLREKIRKEENQE